MKQVSGRTIALVAAAIAAVGVLIIGLVVGLSSDDRSAADDAGATELTVNSYGLPYRAAISLHVPTDWYVIEDPTDPEWFWLVHSAEPVTYPPRWAGPCPPARSTSSHSSSPERSPSTSP